MSDPAVDTVDTPHPQDTAPQTDWLTWRCWRIIGGTLSALTFMLGAIGLWFVYFELQQGLNHRKADQALGFVERFNSDVYVTARNEVLRPWLAYQAQLGLANDFGGMPKEQIDQLTTLIVQQDRAAGGALETHILTLVNFFDELAVCVTSDICDPKTSCQYFQKRAQDLDSLYGPVLRTLGTTFDLNNAGSGLKTIAELDQCT